MINICKGVNNLNIFCFLLADLNCIFTYTHSIIHYWPKSLIKWERTAFLSIKRLFFIIITVSTIHYLNSILYSTKSVGHNNKGRYFIRITGHKEILLFDFESNNMWNTQLSMKIYWCLIIQNNSFKRKPMWE